ncbi:DNA partition complex ParG [Providencia rettgeri]|uniref:ParG n=1 Tax=Providencia rettgeri TaxID=587 RepID=A0A220DIU1_PRORE|nr:MULTISPECIES: plasmid partition protein ParG [Morganellaceae]USR67100.1 DNA partition complex ParG [Providencia stuartii]HCE8950637.1 DNA partition complex ParG [Morganella morganii]ARV76141.1 ParG [Providencia rettgeri]EJD6048959.1 DNA partition complex ParG [Providencia rettgeri]EJD6083921.1 DNA partition complex ParG [Providencia rettgeri]
MALEKVNESSNSQKMKFGENRDLDKILEKSTKTKRINVDLDEDTQIRFKAACVKRNTTMKDVISDYVHQWLKQNE